MSYSITTIEEIDEDVALTRVQGVLAELDDR